MGLGKYEALVLGDLYEVDVVGGGDGEQAALPGYEEEVGHLSLLLQLQGQLNAGPPVHQHSPALPRKKPVLSSVPDPNPDPDPRVFGLPGPDPDPSIITLKY